MTTSPSGKGKKNKTKNVGNNDDPPGQHHRHDYNNTTTGHGKNQKQKQRSTRRLSNLIDDLPFTSREFVTAALSKDDVMMTYDHIAEHQNEHFGGNGRGRRSFRSLDATTEKYAKAISTRNLMNNIGIIDGDDELGLATSKSLEHQQQQQAVEDDVEDDTGGGCCSVWKSFEEDPTAKGYSMLGVARGTILMSNVFLSTSLIFLASVQAGCVDSETNQRLDECDGKAFGFKPTSLITNISIISGLLAAFFVPVFGAVIDYTPHRRLVGIVSAILITIIQGVQIATIQQTWFVMAWLQAIAGFLFFVQVMATFAYLPEMARNVGGDTMNHYTKWFTFIQFLTQVLFLIVVIVPGFIFSMDNVMTAQLGQGISTVSILIGFTYAWGYNLPNRPAARDLPQGHSLWLEGFRQNYRTIKIIAKHYKKGLKWFILTNTVAEAGVSALLPVGITFLTETLKFDALQIGITFAITLITSLPGSFIGAICTARTNPKRSWQICLAYFVVVTLGGTFALTESRSFLGYVWGGLWGVGLGWFYPVENLMFSLCLPRGYENEMTGMFVYTSQILGWLPPLVFTLIIEAGASTRFGFLSLLIFQAIGIVFLMCMAPWEEVLEESGKIVKPENEGEEEDDKAALSDPTSPNNIDVSSNNNSNDEVTRHSDAKDSDENSPIEEDVEDPLAPVSNHPSKRPSADEETWRQSRAPPRLATQYNDQSN